MRHFFFTLTLLFLSFAILGQEELFCKDIHQLLELEKQQYRRTKSFTSPNTATSNYDLKYHRLEWEVDPAIRYISGAVTSFFIPIREEFNQIHFDLESNMTVNAVTYHGQQLSFIRTSDDRLQISLPKIIPKGKLDSITVTYEGEPVNDGFGSFMVSTHNNTPVLWTLSEPFGAKTWWPCKQDLQDKIDSIDIIVTTPNAYRVGTNGILISERTLADQRKVYHWKHSYPIASYLISLTVTNYVEFTDYVHLENGKSIPILNYVYPENLNSARMQLQNTIEQMELFNELFGLYPFSNEKYGHAQFGWGGGMEHQTMSSMGGFSYGLQAHELAHQWFGNKVTCASWADIWLNEGFATYLAALTSEFLSPNSDNWRSWKISTINAVTSKVGGSTWVSDTTNINLIFNYRLSYQKGALLLHMLRWILGDEQFFQGVRNYLNDPRLAYGYALTTDLQRHLEYVSGLNLDTFFMNWYYGQGYPSYTIRYTPRSTGVTLIIDQQTSHPSVDFFAMPIPIKVSDGIQDTLLRLEHTFSGQSFHIPLPFPVASVEFDPDKWIISRNNQIQEVVTYSEDLDFVNASIDIWPNPANEAFEIRFMDNLMDQWISLSITDSSGKTLYQTRNIKPLMRLDTSKWIPGSYFLTFETRKGNCTRKIIIR